MVHNGILMETIGISVMVSIGLLFFFFSRASFLQDAGTLNTTQFFYSLLLFSQVSCIFSKIQTDHTCNIANHSFKT